MEEQVSERARKQEAQQRRHNAPRIFSEVLYPSDEPKLSLSSTTQGTANDYGRRPSRFTIRKVSSQEIIVDASMRKVQACISFETHIMLVNCSLLS